MKTELAGWLDEERMEAEVRITDGDVVLNVFCDRFTGYREYEQLELMTLHAADATIVEGYIPPRQTEGWAGEMAACIADRKKNLLRFGNLIIDFDGYLPGDAVEGQWIRFSFARLEYI